MQDPGLKQTSRDTLRKSWYPPPVTIVSVAVIDFIYICCYSFEKLNKVLVETNANPAVLFCEMRGKQPSSPCQHSWVLLNCLHLSGKLYNRNMRAPWIHSAFHIHRWFFISSKSGWPHQYCWNFSRINSVLIQLGQVKETVIWSTDSGGRFLGFKWRLQPGRLFWVMQASHLFQMSWSLLWHGYHHLAYLQRSWELSLQHTGHSLAQRGWDRTPCCFIVLICPKTKQFVGACSVMAGKYKIGKVPLMLM